MAKPGTGQGRPPTNDGPLRAWLFAWTLLCAWAAPSMLRGSLEDGRPDPRQWNYWFTALAPFLLSFALLSWRRFRALGIGVAVGAGLGAFVAGLILFARSLGGHRAAAVVFGLLLMTSRDMVALLKVALYPAVLMGVVVAGILLWRRLEPAARGSATGGALLGFFVPLVYLALSVPALDAPYRAASAASDRRRPGERPAVYLYLPGQPDPTGRVTQFSIASKRPVVTDSGTRR